MTYIQRFQEKEIQTLLGKPEIIVVTGPRQAGKTTLVQHALGVHTNAISYTFDSVSLAQQFTENPDAFYVRYMKPYAIIFFDEIQRIEDSGRILKYLYDTYHPRIVVSGSSAPDIAVQSLQYLVGRVSIVEIFPLSLHEFLHYKDPNLYSAIKNGNDNAFVRDIQLLVSEYMMYGGYPRVVLEESHEGKLRVLANIYDTLLLREVRDLFGLVDTEKLQKFIAAIALNQGNLTEYKMLAKASGYSFDSVKKFLALLNQVYVVRTIAPYFSNKLKEIVKAPKVYFIDSGLRNHAVHDFRDHALRIDKGNMLEALTLALLSAPSHTTIHFWRDKAGHEIDFVRLGEGLVPELFECKWEYRSISQETLDAFTSLHGKVTSSRVITFAYGAAGESLGVWSVGDIH
jgi:uncharacterized protein